MAGSIRRSAKRALKLKDMQHEGYNLLQRLKGKSTAGNISTRIIVIKPSTETGSFYIRAPSVAAIPSFVRVLTSNIQCVRKVAVHLGYGT
jgi:hypothetical protein